MTKNKLRLSDSMKRMLANLREGRAADAGLSGLDLEPRVAGTWFAFGRWRSTVAALTRRGLVQRHGHGIQPRLELTEAGRLVAASC